MNRAKTPELLLLPNLLSLSRILLTPAVGYFLWRDDYWSTVVCLCLLVVAAITDGLDGYLARRRHLVTNLGLILDPLADKIFAATLLVEVVLFRQFPMWLAAVIVGRDLLILLAATLVMKKRKTPIPSNLTGQYTFFSIVILIGFSIIRFERGTQIVAAFALFLIGLSMGQYLKAFLAVVKDRPIPRFTDRPIYRILRVGATAVVLVTCLVFFIIEEL